MKKLMLTSLIVTLFAVSGTAQAELEISGNVTTVAGYQRDGTNSGVTHNVGGLTQGDLGAFAASTSGDHFRYLVDQVELDIENEFGENIRARADIDFRDVIGSNVVTGDAMSLEQGYVTANIGWGNGLEFLVGKFNAPLGLENNDRYQNVFSTVTPGKVFITPNSVIGMKIYYEFNDTWSFDLATVNNMNGPIAANSSYPSAIFRIGATWGDEGRQSFINLGAGFGPETATNTSFDLLGMLWGNWAFGESWDVGWSGEYRQTEATLGATNRKAYSGQLYAQWHASDAWSVQLRVAAFLEPDAAAAGSVASRTGAFWNTTGAAGFEGTTLSGTLGTSYQITDGANMKVEYRFDNASVTGAADGSAHTGAVEFGYSF